MFVAAHTTPSAAHIACVGAGDGGTVVGGDVGTVHACAGDLEQRHAQSAAVLHLRMWSLAHVPFDALSHSSGVMPLLRIQSSPPVLTQVSATQVS